MADHFYRDFEDKFRGSRTTIRRRLDVYLPFIRPLIRYHEAGNAVDLGCGRGEWLEILRQEGISATGIDLDEGMLDACRQLNLAVENGDAIEFLQMMSEESQFVVSAFHLVEHIPFDSLLEMTSQALRVLKPGGLLILETPNPENLLVATSSFYLDPTHVRPIPSQLLAYIADYAGFKRTKILRLQETAELLNTSDATLLEVLAGVSPDYAIIAQKAGDSESITLLNSVFHLDYGLSLGDLASKFQQGMENRFSQTQSRLAEIDVRTEQAQAKAVQAQAKAVQAQAKAEQAQAKAEQAQANAEQAQVKAEQFKVRTEQAEFNLEQLHSQLMAVYSSSSWRLTSPLRWLFDALHKISSMARPILNSERLEVRHNQLIDHDSITHTVQSSNALSRDQVALEAPQKIIQPSDSSSMQTRPSDVSRSAHTWGSGSIEPRLNPRSLQIVEDLSSAINTRLENKK
jgi:O-antigen chain-terminating methyltransferase